MRYSLSFGVAFRWPLEFGPQPTLWERSKWGTCLSLEFGLGVCTLQFSWVDNSALLKGRA